MSGRMLSSYSPLHSRMPFLWIVTAINLMVFELERHPVLGIATVAANGIDGFKNRIEHDPDYDDSFPRQSKYLEMGISQTKELLERKKRNIFQLGKSFLKNTKYSPVKLANYGNWCGIGGDRHNDGSYIDGCDLCCKKHDKCYHRARTLYSGCNPRFVTYEMGSSDENGYTPCNDAPSCAREVCRCDSRFVACMKKEPCPPLKVYENVSYFWWMMPSKDKGEES